jgi:hypothetical protein
MADATAVTIHKDATRISIPLMIDDLVCKLFGASMYLSPFSGALVQV